MLKDLIKRVLVPSSGGAAAAEPGLRSWYREADGAVARFHLRVERDGSGLLLANASSACRLSPTGVAIADGLLSGADPRKVASTVARRFSGASGARIGEDVARVAKVLEEMTRPDGGWPLRDLDEVGASAHRRTLSAPLVADLAVGEPETTRAIVRKLWDAGVPQLVLLPEPGGDPAALVGHVELAEDLGMITGVRARASELPSDDGLLEDLVQAGLDRLDLLWGGPAHDALFGAGDAASARAHFEKARSLELCPVAVVPVVEATIGHLRGIADEVSGLGVPAAVFYALHSPDAAGALRPEALAQAAAEAEEAADHLHLNLVWAAPVRLAPGDDLAAAAVRGPRCAGEAAVRVRADGAVIPPTGPARAAGNLLRDPWTRIWNDSAFAAYREAVDDPPRCETCPGLAVCASGCPKDPVSWALPEDGGAA